MSEITYKCGWCGVTMDKPYMTLTAKFRDDKTHYVEGYFCEHCYNVTSAIIKSGFLKNVIEEE